MRLDKSFGFLKNCSEMYELWEEVGRGSFSLTCIAAFKKGELEGRHAAVRSSQEPRFATFLCFSEAKFTIVGLLAFVIDRYAKYYPLNV